MRSFIFILLMFSGPAYAGPTSLFECFVDSMIVQKVSVYTYQGRLFLLTSPPDGEGSSRYLDREEWESRVLIIANTHELRGALYKSENQWYFKFKDSSGWSSSGTANCTP